MKVVNQIVRTQWIALTIQTIQDSACKPTYLNTWLTMPAKLSTIEFLPRMSPLKLYKARYLWFKMHLDERIWFGGRDLNSVFEMPFILDRIQIHHNHHCTLRKLRGGIEIHRFKSPHPSATLGCIWIDEFDARDFKFMKINTLVCLAKYTWQWISNPKYLFF